MRRSISTGSAISTAELTDLLAERADSIRAFASRRLRGRTRIRVSPDDIFQDVCRNAYRAISAFTSDGPSSFDRWLLTITKNALIDALRKYNRAGEFRPSWDGLDDSLTDYFYRLAGSEGTPSSQFALREAVEHLKMALNSLCDNHKRAIWFCDIEGATAEQAAQRMSTTVPAVKSFLYRGRKQLRLQMGSASQFFSDAPSSDGNPRT
ncbi:MAG: sigma-70 family RNA polymerase sigma factor [Phycisphaerales bacterium]|nr:sigma-70 family RNA polymerase sigma factor [Phycisphaerales bacterium]